MSLHSKNKGSIGELKVAADLIERGFSVFTELGDNSKVDLVAIDNKSYKSFKIQVKTRHSKNNAVEIETKKSGPNYSFIYKEKHSDVYAIYVPNQNAILYISSKEFLKRKASMSIRFTNSKYKNPRCNLYKDYLSARKACGLEINE